MQNCLADLACKYLKWLRQQRSASAHTLAAYAVDFGQFLAPIGVGKILFTDGADGSFSKSSGKKVILNSLI